MRWLRRRAEKHQRLDRRVADATARAAEAAEEARLSQVRHDAVKDRIVGPLREAGNRNRFADMLRASIAEGYGRRDA